MNPAPIFECFSAYQKTAAMQAAVDIFLFSALAKGGDTRWGKSVMLNEHRNWYKDRGKVISILPSACSP